MLRGLLATLFLLILFPPPKRSWWIPTTGGRRRTNIADICTRFNGFRSLADRTWTRRESTGSTR
jgi:hypothetical protein